MLPEQIKRWNDFIEIICTKEMETLSPVQKNAVLCFWYDAEMNNGGHSGYFDCYQNVNADELINAINIVAYKEISDNFIQALYAEEDDGWCEEDDAFYEFKPSLSECIMKYVEEHRDEIFDL